MYISSITQHGIAGRPTLNWESLLPGLNALYGPPHSGKSALTNMLACALFGKTMTNGALDAPSALFPGEIVVEGKVGRHCVRLYRDDHEVPRLTVAALDGSAVDATTMHRHVGELPPNILSPLCAISFCEPPNIARLLSADFARGYQSISGRQPLPTTRRTAELAARRDMLAQELETRLAGERRASGELESRSHELDRLIRQEQEKITVLEHSLRAAETALAETDSRLRYRRLELNVQLQRSAPEPPDMQTQHVELDSHAKRLRTMLADLAEREANVRAQLSRLDVSADGVRAALNETQAWLAVSRQLAGDLAGEVSRLARASASQQCVCRDAHPRLRPVSETIHRHLDVLSKLVDVQHRSIHAAELQSEVDQLVHSQTELRRHLNQLLARRQPPSDTGVTLHRLDKRTECDAEARISGPSDFTAADAEQLESRRMELEQHRFNIIEQLRSRSRTLRDLRAQRETVERQRAALLSARSIEHVQRELTSVQRKLEEAARLGLNTGDPALADDSPARASDYLAQLTDGELVRLILVEQGRRACVVNRNGETLRVEALVAADRDLVYISLCLALLSAARRQGICLPLVLDEPFERLEARAVAALATVLEDISRQGHQVIVCTAHQSAIERLASVGAAVQNIHDLRHRRATTPMPVIGAAQPPSTHAAATVKSRKKKRPNSTQPKQTTLRQTTGEEPGAEDRSDAA